MTNQDKLAKLAQGRVSTAVADARHRRDNREMLRESREIALKILEALYERKMTQRVFAKEMSVSPQQVAKWVRGTENMTLSTMVKIQKVLNIQLLATAIEREQEKLVEIVTEELSFSITAKVERADGQQHVYGSSEVKVCTHYALTE